MSKVQQLFLKRAKQEETNCEDTAHAADTQNQRTKDSDSSPSHFLSYVLSLRTFTVLDM